MMLTKAITHLTEVVERRAFDASTPIVDVSDSNEKSMLLPPLSDELVLS